jgi:cytochrome c553
MKSLIVALAAAGFSSFAFGDVAATWTAKCKSCHGADGNGTVTAMGKKPNSGLKDYTSADVQAAMKDDDMFTAIKDGVKDTKMPGYAAKGLTDDDIKALVAHIRTLKK